VYIRIVGHVCHFYGCILGGSILTSVTLGIAAVILEDVCVTIGSLASRWGAISKDDNNAIVFAFQFLHAIVDGHLCVGKSSCVRRCINSIHGGFWGSLLSDGGSNISILHHADGSSVAQASDVIFRKILNACVVFTARAARNFSSSLAILIWVAIVTELWFPF
jgi:hypothetical protein